MLHFDRIPLYGVFIITFGAAIIVGIVVRIAFVPWYRKKIQSKYKPIYINDEISDIGGMVVDTLFAPSTMVDCF